MIVKDVEDLLVATRDLLINNLNPVIDAINTEKGDTLLSSVTANEFHLFLRSNPPTKKFFNIYSGSISTPSNRQEKANVVEIFCEAHVIDNLSDDTYFKSLRYTRAMAQVLRDNSFFIDNSTEFIFEQISPYQELENDSFKNRIIGGVRFTIDFI